MSALNFRIVQHNPPKCEGQTTEERLKEIISHQETEMARLRKAAMQDPVTGGASLRCLAMSYDWLEDDDPVSLLLINLNGFRKINDALGRDRGDAVLTAVHADLERCLRWDDVAAREGCDRFIALLPMAIEQDGQAVGERVRESIQKMVFQSAQGRFKVTARVVCVTREGRESLNDLVSRADRIARSRAGREPNTVVAG